MRKKLARYKSPDVKLLKSEGYGRKEKKQMSRARRRLRKADILHAGQHDWALRKYVREKRKAERAEKMANSWVVISVTE